jgi:hypothetical protein
LQLAIFVHDGMTVIDMAVEDVENIAANRRSQGHGAPILRHAIDAKGVRDQTGVDSKEHAIGEAGDTGDEDEPVWGRYLGSQELADAKGECRNEKAPKARAIEAGD